MSNFNNRIKLGLIIGMFILVIVLIRFIVALEIPKSPSPPTIDEKVMCQNECNIVGEKKCSDINNYQVCGNYNNDTCLEWGSPTSCPIEYNEQLKCRANGTTTECMRWCGDGVCSNINQCNFIDDPFGGHMEGFCYQETCLTCSQDCGSCAYGTPGKNNGALCGSGGTTTSNRYIRRKNGNLQISSPEIMKTKVNEWIYSDPRLYHQVKNSQFDAAVQTLAYQVGNIFSSSGYCLTTCPDPNGNAPTSASEILNGSCGLCADYANLWLSLLRTMNIPSNRATVITYPVISGGTHAAAVYISDSGQPWILNYGVITSNLNDIALGGLRCDSSSNYWRYRSNDATYAWSLPNGVIC